MSKAELEKIAAAFDKSQAQISDLRCALRDLLEETQDWEDALGEERPTLVACRKQAARLLRV